MNFIVGDEKDFFLIHIEMKLIFNLFSINIDLINNLNH